MTVDSAKRRAMLRALAVAPWITAGVGVRARAQAAGAVRRIGYLSTPTRESVRNALDAFLAKLRELGWDEGRNLVIEYRFADGDVGRLPALAADLVRRNVELIVAPAGSAALAASHATSTIPIVLMFASDPVALGLVRSLNRPGTNVTGTTFAIGREIYGKQLQYLKEAVPRASRVAVLGNSTDASFALQKDEIEAVARVMGVALRHIDVRGPDELEGAFAIMAKEGVDALLVTATSTFLPHRRKMTALAARNRLPAMYSFREFVEDGGLMAYAVNMSEFSPHAATYVDRILRGARPADLPIEQPTRFELLVNVRTAQALGIDLPRSFLLRADNVIR